MVAVFFPALRRLSGRAPVRGLFATVLRGGPVVQTVGLEQPPGKRDGLHLRDARRADSAGRGAAAAHHVAPGGGSERSSPLWSWPCTDNGFPSVSARPSRWSSPRATRCTSRGSEPGRPERRCALSDPDGDDRGDLYGVSSGRRRRGHAADHRFGRIAIDYPQVVSGASGDRPVVGAGPSGAVPAARSSCPPRCPPKGPGQRCSRSRSWPND